MPMEAKDIFEANSRNVRELLSEPGLGLYIPPYQRPYGWDKEKVNKLVEDTLHGYSMLLQSPDSFTFLGTVITIHDINYTTVQPIVRPEVPGKVLTVIDGQQRLTTLLLVCVALHNQIRLAQLKMIKGKKPEEKSAPEQWLEGQTLRVLSELDATFVNRQPYGDSPLYPRMIRSFDDQWSRSKQNAKYRSPIARLISTYVELPVDKAAEFKPKKREGQIEGEEALVERYVQIAKTLKLIATEHPQKERDLEDLPTLAEVHASKSFQLALLNHEIPDDVSAAISAQKVSPEFVGLLNVVLVACYLMNRVAVTVVRGKNEDYAFTVFESLNTTGEPLTAFETFKPKVVSAEGIEKYENSDSRKYLDHVSNYLSEFKVGDQLQAATRDLLIIFASAETGFKLSKRLADQRRYLKDEFERYEQSPAQRLAFVQNLRDVAGFVQHAWEFEDTTSPSLSGLPVEATTDAVKLCLKFLTSLQHSITIGAIVRFYSAALYATDADRPERIKDLEGALKAIAAFSALWRASRRGTANIDQEYRDLLAGINNLTALPPLARSLKKTAAADTPSPAVNLAQLKAELRARLASSDHGGLTDRATFVADGTMIPAYQNGRPVARFILLAAYHDAVPDETAPGLIAKGKSAVSPCLTYEGFNDERHLSLEHIAPQSSSQGWASNLWENKETVHRLGNLVLVKKDANSSLSDRPWVQKRALYGALSAASHGDAGKILTNSGFDFGEKTQEIAQMSSHMPHLAAVSQKADDWSSDFISTRGERLLGLAWDQLYSWLV
ncbi:DUF262 domain-containing protein [Nevskia ramosa]|uniref:DUF262 domain-containing protein n=1 Tax=Nevskia ramosa TaxID=64002 RepID=UPI0023557D3C|nr:DUF262 domain-containing HNH endonuclease family protein [Nevskia ramosa]